MKKIMWAVSLISLIGTGIVLQFMPETVPMHYDIAGNIDRWGSKYENLIFSLIIIILAVFWTLMIRYYEKKAEQAKYEKDKAGALTNAKVLRITGLSMAVMFTVMQAFILYGACKKAVSGGSAETPDLTKVSMILMGILYIILGNFMTKTRRNQTVGLRISWSMYNDNTWRKTNRFGAYALITAGILTVITVILLKQAYLAVIAALGYLLVAVIVSVIYAGKVYQGEIKAEKEQE